MMTARPGNVGMSAMQRPLSHGPPTGIDTAKTQSRKHTKIVPISPPSFLASVWGDLYVYSHSWCGQRTMLTLALRPTHWAHARVAAPTNSLAMAPLAITTRHAHDERK